MGPSLDTKAIQYFLWYFIQPKEIVQRINSPRSIVLGVAMGILGAFAFPVLSYFSRVWSPDSLDPGTNELLTQTLALVSAFFFGSSVLIYLAAIMFGGRGPILRFMGTLGYSGLFFVLMSAALAITTTLGPKLEGLSGPAKIFATGASVVPVFLSFGLFVAWLRMMFTGLRQVLGVGRWRSIALLVVLLLPLLLIYDSLV